LLIINSKILFKLFVKFKKPVLSSAEVLAKGPGQIEAGGFFLIIFCIFRCMGASKYTSIVPILVL
jgi:hypothetical protein